MEMEEPYHWSAGGENGNRKHNAEYAAEDDGSPCPANETILQGSGDTAVEAEYGNLDQGG